MKILLSYLVSLCIPVALIGLALRLLLTPIFLRIEYNMPYFPSDPYGFTTADRLHWAPFALNYLLNHAGTSYLADLKFDDGRPLYNEREVRHMLDVQNLVQAVLRVWYGVLVALALLAVIAWQTGWRAHYVDGLRRGGWWVIWLAAGIAVIVIVGIAVNPDVFWQFFSGFHSLFFEGDTWLFEYSDTLIRLFPIRFWQDAFLFAAVIVLGSGLALAFGLRR